MKATTFVSTTLLFCTVGFSVFAAEPAAPPVPKDIKAYDLDFNWGPGGPNGFAKPGLWADADPARHVAWYKALGANVIQTFCVSCNGYAWYKDGVVPEQPGLKYDFLRETVRLGHQEGMLVLGYFCAGSNTKWGQEHPDLSYGIPSDPHIPYTDKYLAYLDSAIRDAVGNTGIDGFMIDWLRMPTTRASNQDRWLQCEKDLYAQLMGEPFPGEHQLTATKMTEYGRRAVDRCWKTIRRAAKEANPACIVWLTCCDVNDPHIADSAALRETDWLLNEAGDPKRTADAKRMMGPQTRLITCLANWNGQDPMQIVPAAQKEGVGLYGFTKPGPDSLLPLESLLTRSVQELKGDEKNIAILARAFHGASLESTRTPDGRFNGPKPGDADYPQPSPSERHAQKVAAVKAGNYDLVLIGDSITHTLQDFGGKYEPLNAVWAKHFAPRHAINLGYSGYRTEQILWNLENGELDFPTSPKVVMLLIGTNNTDDRHFSRVHTAEEVFAGTKAIVDLIRRRHPTTKILVLRIFPRGGDSEKGVSSPAFNSSAECIETCRRAGELTARLADDKHVFWLDINHIFLKPDGTINTDLMWDLLHPSPAGAKAWAQAVEPTLARLLGDESASR